MSANSENENNGSVEAIEVYIGREGYDTRSGETWCGQVSIHGPDSTTHWVRDGMQFGELCEAIALVLIKAGGVEN